MLARLRKHALAALGALLWVPGLVHAIRFALEVAGDVDLVSSHLAAVPPSRLAAMKSLLLSPPGWLETLLLLGGVGLIWLDLRRNRARAPLATDAAPHQESPFALGIVTPDLAAQFNPILQKIWCETTVTPRMELWPIRAITDEVKLLRIAARSDVVVVHKLTPLMTETDDLANEVISILRNATRGYRPGKAVTTSDGFVVEAKRLKELLILLRGNDVWVYAEEHEKHLPESWDAPKELEWSNTEDQAILVFGPPGDYGEDTVMVTVDHGYSHINKPLLGGLE